MAWGVKGFTLAFCAEESVLVGEETRREGKGEEEGSRSPSLSKRNLKCVKLGRAAVEENCREDDRVHAGVGDKSMSMSREQVGDAEFW